MAFVKAVSANVEASKSKKIPEGRGNAVEMEGDGKGNRGEEGNGWEGINSPT